MKQYAGVFSVTAMISVVINILMLAGPLFMLQVYDRVLTSGSVPTLTALIIVVGVIYAFMAALEWIRARVMSRLARYWDEEKAEGLFKSLLADKNNLPVASKQFPPLRDLDTVRNFLTGSGPMALFDAPWVPIYIAVIFILHSLLGWFAIAAALLLVTLMLGSQWATRGFQQNAARSHEASHAVAQEAHTQSDFVRALALYDGLANNWREGHKKGLSLQQSALDRSNFFSALTKATRLMLQAGILALGAWLAIHQELSPGSIVACAIILSRGLAPLELLVSQWRNYNAAYAAWRRLEQLTTVKAETTAKTRLPELNGRLSVENLACFIPGLKQPLLAGLDFELQPGESLGVIGPSGVGKSTLLKALLGIWPQTHGDTRLDGATFSQWDRSRLADSLGYVPQDIVLFSGTIAQNIARFKKDASCGQIIEAAKLAQVHDMIVALPDGYDTRVGSGGALLSAGQKQRIALACAFYGNPRLIVLDEPNSNLDEAGSQALARAIKAMSKKGSTIVIATHKMAALAETTKLLMLRDGRQIAFGPRQQFENISTSGRFSVLTGGSLR